MNRLVKTNKGFTLIELTIVIVIMMAAAALVAPLTFKELAKSQAKTEYLRLRNTIKQHTTLAFARGVRYHMQMKDTTLIATSILGEQRFIYEHLTLPALTFVINVNGYPSIDVFELKAANLTRRITLEDMLGVKQDLIYAKTQ
jgi:prepilin-type N-terminal cleavage/methylation domain-containing protein